MDLIKFKRKILLKTLKSQSISNKIKISKIKRKSSFTRHFINKRKRFRKMSRAVPDSEDDEIVISGMSGRFPNSINLVELSENLYNKVDMVDDSEKRWKHTNPNVPRRSGKVDGITKFDATHFKVHSRQVRNIFADA